MTPVTLEHGERYGKLTVLGKEPSGKYRCGCSCGWIIKARAKKLMRGWVKSCKRCATSAKRNQGEKR